MNSVKKMLFSETSDSKSLVKYQSTPYEFAWRAIFILVVLGASFLVPKIVHFQMSPLVADIKVGSIYDFKLSVMVAFFIGLIRYGIKWYFQESLLQYLSDKRLKTIEDGKKRADQLCKWLFDIIYYSSSTLAAFLILKDQKFFPSYLGGPEDGNCDLLFMNYPNIPDVKYLQVYYLVQAGTHGYTFVHQICCKFQDPKYYEFVLHHGLALFLIVFSYLTNMTLIGSVVLFLHDPADVLLILARGYTDYKNRKVWVNVSIFIVTWTSWVFFRNIVLPSCVIRSCINFLLEPKSEALAQIMTAPLLFQTVMLTTLAIMHVYWIFFMTKAALAMLRTGKDKNGYDS